MRLITDTIKHQMKLHIVILLTSWSCINNFTLAFCVCVQLTLYYSVPHFPVAFFCYKFNLIQLLKHIEYICITVRLLTAALL